MLYLLVLVNLGICLHTALAFFLTLKATPTLAIGLLSLFSSRKSYPNILLNLSPLSINDWYGFSNVYVSNTVPDISPDTSFKLTSVLPVELSITAVNSGELKESQSILTVGDNLLFACIYVSKEFMFAILPTYTILGILTVASFKVYVVFILSKFSVNG